MRFAVAVVAIALLLSGCADTTSNSASPSSAALGTATPIPNAQTFTSAGTGFSISWDSAKLASSTNPSRPALAERTDLVGLGLDDRDAGNQPFPWKGVGGLNVLAQRMSLPDQAKPPSETKARKLLTEMPNNDALAPFVLVERWEGLRASDFGPVTLGGASGYRATYTWPGGRAQYYLLFSGLDVYRIKLASSDDSLESIWPTLQATLQSFTVNK
jgi:hypothetical protein